MLSEAKIREMYERAVKLYAKTGSQTFLERITTLEDILEITPQEFNEIFEKYANERSE